MVLLAFVGGFQKGVVKIFSTLLALLFAVIIVLWSVPYLYNFLNASALEIPAWLGPVIILGELAILSFLGFKIIKKPEKTKKKNDHSLFQNVMGGVLLSVFMLLSMAILSGFAEQTHLLTEKTKHESTAYKILDPVHQKSREIWHSLTSHVTNTRGKDVKVKEASIDG
jgi:amino acid transporter